MKKVKDFDYYRTRIDKGFYPSARIFRQSMGRSLLKAKDKQHLIEYAVNALPEKVGRRMDPHPESPEPSLPLPPKRKPGRPKKATETVEVPSLTPQILQMVEDHTIPQPTLPSKIPERRRNRLYLIIRLLSTPARQDILTLVEDALEDGMVHQDFHDVVQNVARLLDGHG